jgi:hypothetical protein
MPGSANPGRIDVYDPGSPATIDMSFDCFGQGGSVELRDSAKQLGSSQLTVGQPGTIAVHLPVGSGLTHLELARKSVPANADATSLCTLISTSTVS